MKNLGIVALKIDLLKNNTFKGIAETYDKMQVLHFLEVKMHQGTNILISATMLTTYVENIYSSLGAYVVT